MNNRELVDYILSNQLKKDDVIKQTEVYYGNESIMYIFNDGGCLYDEYNKKISIFKFRDARPMLSGNIAYKYTYQIVSREQAKKEIFKRDKQRKIEELERQLQELKEMSD